MANMRSCLFLLLFLYYIQVMTYCLDFRTDAVSFLLHVWKTRQFSSVQDSILQKICFFWTSYVYPVYFFISICKKVRKLHKTYKKHDTII